MKHVSEGGLQKLAPTRNLIEASISRNLRGTKKQKQLRQGSPTSTPQLPFKTLRDPIIYQLIQTIRPLIDSTFHLRNPMGALSFRRVTPKVSSAGVMPEGAQQLGLPTAKNRAERYAYIIYTHIYTR